MTRLVWQFIGTLLLVGLLIKYWSLVALVLAACSSATSSGGRYSRIGIYWVTALSTPCQI